MGTLANRYDYFDVLLALNRIYFSRCSVRQPGISTEAEISTTDMRNAKKLLDEVDSPQSIKPVTVQEAHALGLITGEILGSCQPGCQSEALNCFYKP